ncbi:hypothetical protein K491DRAFT_593668 [Lophiostoma macrostomum CBS 122681]|uniref:CUE domain-containing protein n=1 Tax=Lophiostoma macrostomum CBS 122681 TaxID=1314788 RepID=A0A6A6TE38_9PLEO|nr:hypothetical protein K491DRAFT_593668 [Lophiostoma macrostomum CBS 122681]
MVPPIVPFPDSAIRQQILPIEWAAYLDSWLSASDQYLRLNDREFHSALSEPSSLSTFIVSFFRELAGDATIAPSVVKLRKRAFLLLHRTWSGDYIPPELLEWSFLAHVCHAFPKSAQLQSLLQKLWQRKAPLLEKSLQAVKSSLIKLLDSKSPEQADETLHKLGPLLKLSPETGTFMLTGSDFLDALDSAYPKSSQGLRKKLVITAYISITAVLRGPKPNLSLLSDQLYELKTAAERTRKAQSESEILLTDLVTNTPLLEKIRDNVTASEGARVRNIAASLSAFQKTGSRPKKFIHRKIDKGKGKAGDIEYGHGAVGDVHVHRMSLVTQIQDLFPDLGPGFVVKLLDEYKDNVEEVTAHLLEDSLPPHLSNADRTEQLPSAPLQQQSRLPPRTTPPPYERRNVFDDDEFDKLTVDAARLQIGKKQGLTADKILSDRSKAPNKSTILSALAAFDSDDDERDDTYDVEDVGGTIDTAIPGADEADADLRDRNEEALFRAYSMTPDVFGRDAETRRGKARAALKSETAMTDEAIEGWGIMIGRDPKRLRRLEAKFSAFSGQQRELASSAYRESPADSGEEANGEGQRGGRGGFSGRGRGRGRGRGGSGGRGGGNVAGPSDDKSTQASRQRKESNKGSRANHNRRDQRAKKMARGGFSG